MSLSKKHISSIVIWTHKLHVCTSFTAVSWTLHSRRNRIQHWKLFLSVQPGTCTELEAATLGSRAGIGGAPGVTGWGTVAIPASSYCRKLSVFCGSNDYRQAPVVSLMYILVPFIVVVTTYLRERTTKGRKVDFGSCFGGTVWHGRKGFSDRIMRQLPTLSSPFRSRERWMLGLRLFSSLFTLRPQHMGDCHRI